MKKSLVFLLTLCFCCALIVGCHRSQEGNDTVSITESTETAHPTIETESESAVKEPIEEDSPLSVFLESLEDGTYCAAASLGYLDGTYDEIMAHIEDMGFLEKYPFLEIPKERYASLNGGELYAIVPYDKDAKITVYNGVLDETDFSIKPGSIAAEFAGGMPVLLKCNVSEIMPNVVVEITSGEETHQFSPCLSGKDGHLVTIDGVYDFSSYDILFAGFSDESVS